jgi:hypothetical protein
VATQGKLIATLTNDTVGSANPSVVDFDIEAGVDIKSAAMRVMIYLVAASSQCMAVGTRVTGIRWRDVGQNGSVDVAFDPAEHAVQRALIAAQVAVPQEVAYGRSLGGGGLAPIGTSVCVSEYTAFPGRSGRGRHFLPFITSLAVDSAGTLKDTSLDALQVITDQALGIDGTSPFSDLNLCVRGPAQPDFKRVQSAKVRKTLSNLESRRN